MLNTILLATATADNESFINFFQGISTLFTQFSDPAQFKYGVARVVLILVAIGMIYLGRKGVLEGLLMIPMGLGMIAVNAGMLMMPGPNPDILTIESGKAEQRIARVVSHYVDQDKIYAEVVASYQDIDPKTIKKLSNSAIEVIAEKISLGAQLKDIQSTSIVQAVKARLTDKAIKKLPHGKKLYQSEKEINKLFAMSELTTRVTILLAKELNLKIQNQISTVASAECPAKFEIQNLMVKSTFDTDSVSGTVALMGWLQINCMQPIYTFTFSNGLIACFVFMGIGALLDVGYVLARPFQSMFIALCAEMGTILTLPLAMFISGDTYTVMDAASIAMVGCADGPMVLFTALQLSPSLFAPITVVAYLYLGLCYGGYPYLVKWLIPEKLRAIVPEEDVGIEPTPGEKLAFVVLATIILCALFPVAAPLLLSLFLGIATKEADLKQFHDLLSGPVLYFSTLILGLLLGLLCDAQTMLDPKVMWILILGITALLISGLGGIAGGYIMYFVTGGKYNPVIGIAGVSCVPTCAKVAQKAVSAANPAAIVMPHALGVTISGVITSAIICAVYIELFKDLAQLLK